MQITPLARAVNHVLAADTPLRVDLAPSSTHVEWPPRKSRFLALIGEGASNRILIGSRAPQDFPDADVVPADDAITLVAHGFETGDGPFRLSTNGTLPTGLATATDYYVIATDADTFQLATSRTNALDGSDVDLTDQGSGTHGITGVQNVAFPPAATIQDGSGGLLLLAGQSVVIQAPKSFTVVGDTDAVLTYFFVEGDTA
jgi:hypothetical protein